MSGPIRVGIALVEKAGRYLVRRRPVAPGSPMPGYWEFPGGKCAPDETPEAGAIRECWEESGLHVVVQGLRRSLEHRYPHGFVQLHYFDCIPRDRTDEPAPDSGFRWVSVQELLRLTFPEANELILQDLARTWGVDD